MINIVFQQFSDIHKTCYNILLNQNKKVLPHRNATKRCRENTNNEDPYQSALFGTHTCPKA